MPKSSRRHRNNNLDRGEGVLKEGVPMATDKSAVRAVSALATSLKDLLAPFVAIVIIVGFIASIIFLLVQTSVSDLQWARDVYLFGGIEAIAFAAAGFLFGTQVQRQHIQGADERAKQANDRAQQSDERAMSATADAAATKARAESLAAAIRSKSRVRGVVSLGALGALEGLEGLVGEQPAGQAGQAVETPEHANGRAAATAQSDISDMEELTQLVDQLFPLATK